MNARAYLVATIDTATGRWIDAGIYSEESPTIVRPGERRVCLLSTVSRLGAADGGYERAIDAIRRLVAQMPQYAWTTRMRTYRLQEENDRHMRAERAAGRTFVGAVRTPKRAA